MKKYPLHLLFSLIILLFLSSIAYCAESQNFVTSLEKNIHPAESNSRKATSLEVFSQNPLVDVVLDLLETDLEYRLSESSALVFACKPFSAEQEDEEIQHPNRHISVDLKFSF